MESRSPTFEGSRAEEDIFFKKDISVEMRSTVNLDSRSGAALEAPVAGLKGNLTSKTQLCAVCYSCSLQFVSLPEGKEGDTMRLLSDLGYYDTLGHLGLSFHWTWLEINPSELKVK